MGLKTGFKERAGSSFMEYVIILGVASAILMGMNTYLKRGIQNRLKEMSDYFISPASTQLVEINPTFSQTETLSEATINNQDFIGGGTRQGLLETKNIHSKSRVKDIEPPFQAPFTPAEAGAITPPPPPRSILIPTPSPPPQGGD